MRVGMETRMEKETTGLSVGSSTAPIPENTSSSTPTAILLGAGDAKLPTKPFYKRHKKTTCCLCCLVNLVITAVIIVALIYTIFKVKDPILKMKSATLQNISFAFSLPTLTPTLNLVLSLNVSVHNPNQASFTYTNSTNWMYYHGLDVGEAPIPAGRIGADADEEIVLLLTVKAAEFLKSSNFTADVASGQVPMQSLTTVSGRVKAFSIYKHHASSTASCDMVVHLSNYTLGTFKCRYKVKL